MADMTAEERAQKTYAEIGKVLENFRYGGDYAKGLGKTAIPAIAQAIRAAERAAYERAAVMAHSHGEFCGREARNGGHTSLFERAEGAAHIAAAIRRLADDA